MAPLQGKKRKSDEALSAVERVERVEHAQDTTAQMIATKTSSPSQESPRKKQKTGISLNQKQALIDNLQLEITERARKLRAQYNLQAQGLRTRIEIRVNRIPMALRKAKMAELVDKYKNGAHPQLSKPTPSASAFSSSHSARPPPVPEKDTPVARPPSSQSATSHATSSKPGPSSRAGPGRPLKRTRFEAVPPSQSRTRVNALSDQISGTNKENEVEAESEVPKKKSRAHPAPEAERSKASRVLSPASSNVRSLPRGTTPGKSFMPRLATAPVPASVPAPSSPVKKPSASNLFSSLAEKARSTRTGGAGRNVNASTSTTASSAAGGSTRGRKAAATATGATGATRGATRGAKTTRTARRASGISETSESSTSTVAKKGNTRGGAGAGAGAADKKAAPATKRTVMGTIRRGVTGTGTKKATAAKPAPASTATGRVLRKRN